MSELITIAKPGEPKLRILIEHLDQHEKLGWTRTFDDVEETVEASEDSPRRGRKPKVDAE